MKVVAYIDGSYDNETKRYGFGGVLIVGDKIHQFKKGYLPDEYTSARNVAGEIKGASYIINFCLKNGITELDLYYDYIGIEKWYKGEWKANSLIAKQYVEFVRNVSNSIKVNFFKVKSHSNDKYNDLADKLAKESLLF